MPKISPFLWFNDNAEEAANFYVSIFKNSRITAVARYGEGAPGPKGSVMTVDFHLDGQDLVLLNGGPHYTLSPAFSFWIKCETQQEVDYYWDKLTPGGQTMQCGWLTDKFGVTWQVVPSILPKLLQDKDPQKSQRVMKAMLQMVKLDIAALMQAYDKI